MKSKLLYERALITCVLMLIVSIILKLFGVPWFNLDTSVPILNKIDDIVMNSVPLSFIYSLVLLSINNFLLLGCSTLSEPKTMCIWTLKFIPINSLLLILKTMIPSHFRIICDILFLLVMGYMINKKISSTFYMMFINILYQFISLFIRSLGCYNGNYGMTSSLLLLLDYYLMFTITYLYLLKGGKTCSISLATFSSLVTKLWRKPTQNSNQCSSKES